MLSRPIPCVWAGWRATTLELQSAGWQLSAHQDVMRDQLCLAIKHPQMGLYGLSTMADWRYRSLRELDVDPWSTHPQHLSFRAIHQQIVIDGGPVMDFHPVDALPTFLEGAPRNLADFAHFAPSRSAEAIVVPDEDVDALLSRILEKQQAAKTEHFRRAVREAGAVPAHRFAAQIISLKAA